MATFRKSSAVKMIPVISRKALPEPYVFKDAPGATPNADWEGNIRAIKWKDQTGTVHKGCKGNVNFDHGLRFDSLTSILLYYITNLALCFRLAIRCASVVTYILFWKYQSASCPVKLLLSIQIASHIFLQRLSQYPYTDNCSFNRPLPMH